MMNSQLRFVPPVFKEELDSGGMFSDKLSVHLDPDGGPKPYFAYAQDGWGRGVGNRYSTLEEAKANLYRLHGRL